jgi:nucleolysin TIA-1/TIAR
MSPTSGGPGYVRRAAPEPNKRALYVGGLDPRVTEEVLRQIFETTGHVQNVKIIPDKNVCVPPITFPLNFVVFPSPPSQEHVAASTHRTDRLQFQLKGFNYGFVEYDDPAAAERAMQTLNGRRVHNTVCHPCALQVMVLIRAGNPCQLGVPVQQYDQGGHV